MGMPNKPDYFGLSDNSDMLAMKSSSLNRSSTWVEAKNARGDIVAQESLGDQASPSASYEVKGSGRLSFSLGKVYTIGNRKLCLGSVTIRTALASVPSVECSGEMVEDTATDENSRHIGLSEITLEHWHDAQILADAFTLGDKDNGAAGKYHLNECTYNLTAEITKATVNGKCVAHDISGGRITVSVTIVQIDELESDPVVTPGDGWTISSPLTPSNPDADYPTWTCELSKPLLSQDAAS